MYWLILHLIWRMISCRRTSLKKMVMISLQVRLYETLCKSNMMSDNFELWGWISVGGWSPQSRHRPKSFAQNTIGFCKSQRNWFNQRKERKTELWTGRRSGKQFPFCCITGTTMSVQFGSGDEKKISSCCFLKIKPHKAFLAGSENNFTFLF